MTASRIASPTAIAQSSSRGSFGISRTGYRAVRVCRVSPDARVPDGPAGLADAALRRHAAPVPASAPAEPAVAVWPEVEVPAEPAVAVGPEAEALAGPAVAVWPEAEALAELEVAVWSAAEVPVEPAVAVGPVAEAL